jgi:hypothetical protein
MSFFLGVSVLGFPGLGHLYDTSGAFHVRYIVYLSVFAFAAAAVSLLLTRTPESSKKTPEASIMPTAPHLT